MAYYAVCISMFQKALAGLFPTLTESLIASMRKKSPMVIWLTSIFASLGYLSVFCVKIIDS